MGWVVDVSQEFSISVKSPEGETAAVFIRKMNEGDYQDRQDLVTQIRVNERASANGKKKKRGRRAVSVDDASMTYMVGEIRKFDLTRSIVRWELPIPFNATNVRNLDPYVAEQIHVEIADLNPFIFGDEEDEEDEDEGVGGVEEVEEGKSPKPTGKGTKTS